MKSQIPSLLTACLAVGLVLVSGCGGATTKLDTTPLEQAFAAADAALKSSATEAIKSLRSGKYLEGATTLATVAKSNEKLNDEQRKAMVDVVTTIQLIMSEDGDKADMKTYQALEDMMARLDGREAFKVGTNPDAVRPLSPPSE